MKYSAKYSDKVVSKYWSTAPATHSNTDQEHFAFYAREINKLIRKYIDRDDIKLLDHGAGEGSISLQMQAIEPKYSISASEKFEKYRTIMQEKGLNVYDAEKLPNGAFDAIFFNCAFYYIHPSKWKSEIKRILAAVKQGGYLFLTDVPTTQKMHVLLEGYSPLKQLILWFIWRITTIYQIELGGYFVDEKQIKQWFPQTIVESLWCPYRSAFVIRRM